MMKLAKEFILGINACNDFINRRNIYRSLQLSKTSTDKLAEIQTSLGPGNKIVINVGPPPLKALTTTSCPFSTLATSST